MAGINYMGGASVSTTDLKKGRADKQTIINVDCLSDALTVDKNINELTNPEKP